MLSKIYTILLVRWLTPSIITLFSGKKYQMEKGRQIKKTLPKVFLNTRKTKKRQVSNLFHGHYKRLVINVKWVSNI